MKKENTSRILWGIGFLAAGIFLLLDKLNVINFDLGFWSIIWTIVFVAFGISCIADKEVFGTVFAIAFLVIIYAKPLHITRLVPWTILGVALLIAIGLNMILKKDPVKSEIFVNGKKVKNNASLHSQEIMSDTSKVETGEDIVINQRISDTSRYIRSQNLRSVTIDSVIGDAEIHLDQASAAGDKVIMNINTTIGNVNLYVPNDWEVINELNSSFGDINYFGHSTGTSTKLILRGNKKIGDLEIHFV
ncbi:LiaF domain-containing protein [Lactobacillus sp.]|uniref:LiaF transmembrane domain-containing protein n=1 Tax=Lactobacillus sp. TaxID=1591 RepID=UPI0019A9A60E|nr:LiaF domain-containing protein [Lactobacillus sp.]MBD5429986.1 cell wall-active antibiotics response protein [Lactobacillus sp.]